MGAVRGRLRPVLARVVALPFVRNLRGVVAPLGFYAARGECAIVTPMLGVLEDALREPAPPTRLAKWVLGIAFTMMQLHARGAVHGDLRPRFVLLDEGGEPLLVDGTVDQICRADRELAARVYARGRPDVDPLYGAPETRGGAPCTREADVYAFGALLARILAPEIAVRNAGDEIALPDNAPERLTQAVRQCRRRAPEERPDFAEIVKKLLRDDAWVFPGTDGEAYREYCARRLEERPREARTDAIVGAVGAVLEAGGC